MRILTSTFLIALLGTADCVVQPLFIAKTNSILGDTHIGKPGFISSANFFNPEKQKSQNTNSLICDPPTHTIAQIQGSGNISTFDEVEVTIRGIVTGIKSNGFFLQTPDPDIDSDPATSEGIFIYTAAIVPATVIVGHLLCVSGTVEEYVPSGDPNSPSQTQIILPVINILSTGNTLPTPILLTVTNTDPSGDIYQLERFEGMRVQVSSMTVISPTEGIVTETTATAESNGQFYAVITEISRPFREPGIRLPDPLPPGAPATIPRWDANPEIVGIASASLGGTPVNVNTGATLNNVTGPLDYSDRVYKINIDALTPPTVTNNTLAFTPIPPPTNDEITVALLNLQRFYDDTLDIHTGCEPSINGNIATEGNLGVSNVTVNLTQIENSGTCNNTTCPAENNSTLAGGNYTFCPCESCDLFRVTPTKNINCLNGVTTFDLVLISRHILGIELLESPYKMIAADANRSRSITTFDIIEIRRVILGINPCFTNNTSWRFVDKDYIFPNPGNPFENIFPESKDVDITNPAGRVADFVAIKVGDVNSSANPTQRPEFLTTLSMPVSFSATVGQTITIPIKYNGNVPFSAYQFSFRFDTSRLSFINVSGTNDEYANLDNFGLNNAHLGIIRTLWFNTEFAKNAGELEAGTHLFNLTFRVKKPISENDLLIQLDNSVLSNLGWTSEGIQYSVGMQKALNNTILSENINIQKSDSRADKNAITSSENNLAGSVVLTPPALSNRLNKLSLAVRTVLNKPDIIGVTEVEKLSTLQTIATKLNTDEVADGNPDPAYIPFLLEGNDPFWLNTGFLVKSSRLNVTGLTQHGLTSTIINPTSGNPENLFDYPPLELIAEYTKPGCSTTETITILLNHFLPPDNINTEPIGDFIRTKRKAQAEFLANLIQGLQIANPLLKIMSIGNYNAFQFNDGYVDVTGTVKGTPTAASEVVQSSPDLVNPDMLNLTDTLNQSQRYTSVPNGNAEMTDHILSNPNLYVKISRSAIGRFAADFPEIYRNDASRPERITNHDVPVAYILLSDIINPVVTCPGNIIVNNDPGQCGSIVNFSVTATDNCSGVTVVSNPSSGSLFPVGTTTVTATATDASGNTANCTFTVVVNDIESPVITCPVPVTVSCTSEIPAADIGSVAVTDNCPGSLITHRGDVISAQTCANRYTVTRTYRATDAAGNFSECTQLITVNDQTGPTMTCPAPLTVNCASAVPIPDITTVTGVSDNCGGPVTVTHVGDVISAQTCANRYTITRTYRATDACGNFAECTQTITVNDQTPPVMTCPAALTVSCASAVPAPNIATVTGVSDNCGGAVTVTHVGDVISAQTCANRYTITRTYRATDVCGNFAECVQIITVNDQTAPAITCPANIIVTTPLGSCTAVVNYTITATDNCAGPVTITTVPSSGTAFPIGVTNVTSTATDVCGNSSTCSFTVTVVDAQLPVITTQPRNSTVCDGSSASFNVVATHALSYQWQEWNGTTWLDITGATNPDYTLNNVVMNMNTRSYRVKVIGLCNTVISNHATLYVNPLPVILLSAYPLPLLLPYQTTTITATANPPGGVYAWFRDGNAIPAVTGPALTNLTVDDIGQYSVVYTDLNGCTTTSGELSVAGMTSDNLFVYPNPTTGQFQIRFYNSVNENVTVNIYDSKGARIFNRPLVTSNITYSRIDVDISNFSAGVYIVEVINSKGIRVGAKKIAKYH